MSSHALHQTPALQAILGVLDYAYSHDWFAPFVLLPLMLGAAWLVRRHAVRKTRPYIAAARRRVEALRRALGDDPDPIAEREAFRRNYLDISAALNETTPGSEPLVQAWREFHESIVDETETPIRNTSRPGVFFHRAAPKQTTLTFASNIFVGVGLILTFLGLIVALNKAAGGMAGGDVAAAQGALTDLLTVAGAKFFTSIGGLGASIWLRFAEYGLTKRVTRETDSICDLLEQGLLYVPPQRLAVEQLAELREQTAQLKFFNQDVAFQIADRINIGVSQAFAPMATSLATLNESMTEVTRGIGDGARKAIEEVSGEQLRGLSETLGSLSQRLDAISVAVGSSGDEAARQIREAGADFAKAATDIRDAFDRLAGRVDGMGGKLAEQGEAAARAQNEALERVLGGLEQAQTRSADAVAEAVAALKDAGARAAEAMQREVGAALATGVAESQRTFKTALEESGEALRETAAGLTRAVGDAAEKIERAGVGFERGGQSVRQTAEAMDSVTSQARTAATTLGEAIRGLATAATPVAQAAQAVTDAAGRIARTLETNREADAETLREMKALAEGVRSTHEAAEMAWREYRARFEGVDKAFAQTADKLAETLGDSFAEFRRFAQDTDRELGAAVSKLGGTLNAIQEYAESLDEYVEEIRRPSLEAAE